MPHTTARAGGSWAPEPSLLPPAQTCPPHLPQDGSSACLRVQVEPHCPVHGLWGSCFLAEGREPPQGMHKASVLCPHGPDQLGEGNGGPVSNSWPDGDTRGESVSWSSLPRGALRSLWVPGTDIFL